MRVHVLQHDPVVGLGVIEHWMEKTGVKANVTRVDLNEPFPNVHSLDFLIILGGRMGAYEEERYPWLVQEKKYIKEAYEAGTFILGICLGSQLIASALGGRAYPNEQSELGWQTIHFKDETAFSHPLLRYVSGEQKFFQFHSDTFDLPKNARLFATNGCAKQGFTIGDRVLAMQFHPEVDGHTVSFFAQNLYPKEKKGPFVQPIERVEDNLLIEQSRQWFFHLLNNFQEQISHVKEKQLIK
ncbi:GMP synthase-like glutamine amidotransferase [Salirhabdus euzebyi]|uniref:GMP synthase-like glutamine amidotransferase n=1 Tax=Salirhabdus euzebyi TaxID=394506 RepID=A0A841Q8V8_9BACI|nr:type 1 glutamine amidotransferase [Salirhabdus euzebyi]MBB6454702.1 GMP synthase-like glutamine amidotransferase [Salirhabdus euzebyi]